MEALYAVDRFEGEIAVLLGDDDSESTVRRQLLPAGLQEGSVLRVPIWNQVPDWGRAVVDEAEQRRRDAEDQARQDRLRRRDPGGDITL